MTLARTVMLAVCAFLLNGADLNEDLLAATRKGDLTAVKSLLDQGASVNAKSPYGSTPLFFACDRGHTEIIKLLIERGADVNVEDTFYHATALTWAMQKKRAPIVKLLLDKGAKSPAIVLASAAQDNNAELAKIALDKGGIDKKTLSDSLAATKNPEISAMLKAAGAEPIKTIQLDDATLAQYAGTYVGKIQGTELELTFAVKNGALSGTLVGQPPLTYVALDKTHFRCVEIAAIEIEFVENGFKLSQGPVKIDFTRKAPAK
jgi:ankyrin repeat protein